MIVVEDHRTYDFRKLEERLQQLEEASKRRAALVHPLKQHILDIVQETGDEPIKITTIANRFAREIGHRWKSREEREIGRAHV